ncbi:TPA: hypothetical protein J7676_004507 [Escherichia coli]|nr:hypothetical protein [Salmonella enterica]HAL6260325.1 hypothetical protein [Escherichia coli]HAL6260487.1 hypothetical protein [Escherichia coli]HAL7117809.1 hypothetical protein [Escherichia coli]HAZ7271058.1 hypothetical protein [Escherichia coli]
MKQQGILGGKRSEPNNNATPFKGVILNFRATAKKFNMGEWFGFYGVSNLSESEFLKLPDFDVNNMKNNNEVKIWKMKIMILEIQDN